MKKLEQHDLAKETVEILVRDKNYRALFKKPEDFTLTVKKLKELKYGDLAEELIKSQQDENTSKTAFFNCAIM